MLSILAVSEMHKKRLLNHKWLRLPKKSSFETIEDFLATISDDNIRVEFIEINGYQRFSGIGEKHI